MIVLVNVRDGHSATLSRLKIRAGKGKPRTPIESLRTADPQYSCGREVRGETIRQLYEQGRSVVKGERVDYVGNIRGYQTSGALPRVIDRITIRTKTHTDMAIDDKPELILKRILGNRGYGTNDLLYDKCQANGEQKIQVNTTIYWVENGRTLQVHVPTIRVKNMTRIEFSTFKFRDNGQKKQRNCRTKDDKLEALRLYYEEFLNPDKVYERTIFDRTVESRPLAPKVRYKFVTEREKRTYTFDKDEFRHRYVRPSIVYDFFINKDDLRDLQQKIKLARMTANHITLA